MKFILFLIFTTVTAYADETKPAGSGTTSDYSVQAFSHPLNGVRGQLRRDFALGNSFFQTKWVTTPSSTPLRDGLGPLYNATSCAACHFKDGRGAGLPETDGRVEISLLFRIRSISEHGQANPHSEYGGQFQPFSLDGINGEGESYVKYQNIQGEFSDGEKYTLKQPHYVFKKLMHSEFTKQDILSPRVGPQMIGLGLIENILKEDILKNEDPKDKNNDGISGRANWVMSVVTKKLELGRFGWKAGKPSLLEQNAAAFNGDIGITSSLFPEEECTYVQVECLSHMTKEDISDELLEKVTTYTQLLAVPSVRILNPETFSKGKKLFYEMKCTSCHTPSYETANNSKHDILNNQKIYPYSDFLLHDMGAALADHELEVNNEELATTREWRTPPLWGLGLVPTVNGHQRLLHDGRASGFEEAILWHGGEATSSKNHYLNLSKEERASVIEFLKSI